MGDALVALGGAFLAAGLLARLGSRVGLPTIPFFMAAGILFGPNTPGIVLVETPADLELFAAVGLIMLLFRSTSGSSSRSATWSVEDCVSLGPARCTCCSTSVGASCSALCSAGARQRPS